MARRPAPVRRGEDRDPPDRHDPLGGEPLGYGVPDHLLDAVERHRREKLAIRELRQAERFARDPDELLHVVVPRRDVGVADRPVDAEPVPRVRLEVEGAPAIHLPAPHDGLATHLAAPDPVERLGRPPARNTGPYDDGVEARYGHQKSPGDARQRPSSVHPLYEPGITS